LVTDKRTIGRAPAVVARCAVGQLKREGRGGRYQKKSKGRGGPNGQTWHPGLVGVLVK